MKNKLMTEIEQRMLKHLDNSQLMELRSVLFQVFDNIPKIERIKTRDLNADKNLAALLDEMKEFCADCKK